MALVSVDIILVLTCIALIIVYTLKQTKRSSSIVGLIKIPYEIPIIGNSYRLIGRNMFDQALKIFAENDTPFIIKTGPYKNVVIDKPEHIQKLNAVVKSDYYSVMPFNDGIFTIKEKFWKPQRIYLLPVFSTTAINKLIPLMNKHSRILQKTIATKLNKNEIDIKTIIGRNMTSQSIETLFNTQIDSNSEEIKFIFKDTQSLFKRGGWNMVLLFALQPFVLFFNLIDWLKRPKEKHLMAFSKKIIAAFDVKETIHNKEGVQNKILIERLVEMKNNPSILNVNVVHNIAIMLSAAVDTSTLTTVNIILLLAMYPHVQEKCYQEIKSIWIDQETDIDFEVLTQLSYLTMVIKECMRVIPTTVGSGKKTIDKIDLGDGLFIPKNTEVFISMFTLHRRKDIWGANANEFNPDNFLPENEEKRPKYSYMPFSYGPRNCIGAKYALTNVKIVIAYMLMNYKFTTNLKLEDLEFYFALTVCVLHDKGKLQIEKRN